MKKQGIPIYNEKEALLQRKDMYSTWWTSWTRAHRTAHPLKYVPSSSVQLSQGLIMAALLSEIKRQIPTSASWKKKHIKPQMVPFKAQALDFSIYTILCDNAITQNQGEEVLLKRTDSWQTGIQIYARRQKSGASISNVKYPGKLKQTAMQGSVESRVHS